MADEASNIRLSAIPSKIITLDRPVRVSNSDIAVACDLEIVDVVATSNEALAAAISDEAANRFAMELAAAIGNEKSAATEHAVYVVDAETPNRSKIGIAKNPRRRLIDLNVSHWERLHLHSLLWVYGNARTIEQIALKTASNASLRLMGEWVFCAPNEAAAIVAEAAKQSQIPVATSIMWMRNRNAMCKERKRIMSDNTPPTKLGYHQVVLGHSGLEFEIRRR